MNEQQTQLLMRGMIQLISRMAAAVTNCDNRIKALEEEEDQESLATFLELMPLVDALTAQIDAPPTV